MLDIADGTEVIVFNVEEPVRVVERLLAPSWDYGLYPWQRHSEEYQRDRTDFPRGEQSRFWGVLVHNSSLTRWSVASRPRPCENAWHDKIVTRFSGGGRDEAFRRGGGSWAVDVVSRMPG